MVIEYVENNVYALRIKHSLTQEHVAAAIGVTRQTVIAIEKGNYTPSVLLALKLAEYFGERVEAVFCLKNKSSQTKSKKI